MWRLGTAALAFAATIAASVPARASNPLEYPDNGSAAFSRGGAWLATASDPIAAHYNPAGLALQGSGVSVELLFAYNHVCFDRRNPGNALTGPRQGDDPNVDASLQYDPVCNQQTAAPRIIPSLALAFRVSRRLGLGFALVPPAAYGTNKAEWPDTARGYNASPGVQAEQEVPASYRYMTLGSRLTILFPTFSAGYALSENLRVGAGFVWGMAAIDVLSASVARVEADDLGDNAEVDSRSNLVSRDLFVPGFVLGAHWSPTRNLDVGAWFRWIDAIESHEADVEVIGNFYEPDLTKPRKVCTNPDKTSAECQGLSLRNEFSGDDFVKFKLPIPPEVRVGVRFHQPRSATKPVTETLDGFPKRDPLKDDVFDVELNASYTVNSVTDRIEIRFRQSPEGFSVVPISPIGRLPPNSDRITGYKDSIGVRLGGQLNAIENVLGLRAGGWVETAAADPEWLHVSPVPALRGGFGGGIVLRHGTLDIQLGYQRHVSAGLDNHGDGQLLGSSGVLNPCAPNPAGIGCPPPGTPPEDNFQVGAPPENQQFRTFHTVNGGSVTQSANVFTAGAVYRF